MEKTCTGPIEEQAVLSLKLSSSFAVRLFCAFSACFMHVFSLLELLTVAVQSMFLDSVAVTRFGTEGWYAYGGDPNGHGITSADRQRTIRRSYTPYSKKRVV